MRTVPDSLRELVRGGHRRQARVRLYSKAGTYLGLLPVESGSVSFAFAGGAGTRSGSLVIPLYSPSNLDPISTLQTWTNLVPDPRIVSGAFVAQGGGVASQSTRTAHADGGPDDDAWVDYTFSGTPTGGTIVFGTAGTSPASGKAAVEPGDIITASIGFKMSRELDVRARIAWRNAAGTALGVTDTGTVTSGTDWQRLAVTGTAPDDTATAEVALLVVNALDIVAGDILGFARRMVLNSANPTVPYFDGTTDGAAWTGDPDLSTSIITTGEVAPDDPLRWAQPPPGQTWAPHDVSTHPLNPFGPYVTVGFYYPDVDFEVELGEFPIAAVQVTRPGGTVTVGLGDWSMLIGRAARAYPWKINEGLSLRAAITQVHTRWFNVTPTITGPTLPDAVDEQIDFQTGAPWWTGVLRIAEANGAYITYTRKHTIDVWAGPSGQAVETLDRGDGGVIETTSADIDTVDVVNRVDLRLIAEDPERVKASSNPDHKVAVRSTVDLTGELRPNAVGVFPYIEERQVTWPTQARGDLLAKRLGERMFGRTRKVDVTAVPMPWIELGDRVKVSSPTGAETDHVESVTFPIDVDAAMSVSLVTELVTTATHGVPDPRGVDGATLLGGS